MTPTEPDHSDPRAAGPVAIVTGASRGIGLAIAEQLAAQGIAPLLVARDAELLHQRREEFAKSGQRAGTCAIDLRDAGAAEQILTACREQLGPPSVLINNAGTAPSARLADTTDADLDITLDLHVRAPLRLIRHCLDDLLASGAGVVVQLASTAGLRGYPFTSAYTAAKHGMIGLTRAIAAEFARDDRLRCHAVCPGFVDTAITRKQAGALAESRGGDPQTYLDRFAAMNRIGRLHDPDEVARAVVELCKVQPDDSGPSARGTVLDLDRDPPAFDESP